MGSQSGGETGRRYDPRMSEDLPPWHVLWERVYISERLSGPWVAVLPSRNRAKFATIGMNSLDRTRFPVCLSPKGTAGPHIRFYVLSVEKGQRMIEKWARYHWESVEAPRRHWEGRSAVRE
jgi:hypothetical protein